MLGIPAAVQGVYINTGAVQGDHILHFRRGADQVYFVISGYFWSVKKSVKIDAVVVNISDNPL